MYVIQRLISRIVRFFPSKIQTAYLLAILCTIPILLFIRYKYGPLQSDSSIKKRLLCILCLIEKYYLLQDHEDSPKNDRITKFWLPPSE